MRISVLVPTYRRPQDLCRCLAALAAQTRPAEEVVVVVRDTDTETLRFLAGCPPALPGLRVVTVSQHGVLAAMTAGLAETHGAIVALTDDDTAPFPDWLERIEACFAQDAGIGGVGGRDWQASDHRARQVVGKIQWHGRVIGNHHLGVGDAREVDLLKGANCAYRAAPLKKIGFETRLRGGGAQVHWELALGLAMRRAGWKLIYDPAIALDHFPAPRFDDDANHRGIFSAPGLTNSVHNETLILLTYLPPVRRVAYLFWALLVGTWADPGPLQVPRLLARRDKNVWQRVCAAYRGRLIAIHGTLHANNHALHAKQRARDTIF